MAAEAVAVLYAYCRLIDERRWGDVTEVFASGASVDFGDGKPLTGPDAIVEALAAVRDGLTASMHALSNVTTHMTSSSTALAHSYVVSHLVLDQRVLHLAGTYTDELIGGPDGWRISSRRFVPIWSEGATEIIDEAMRRVRGSE
jgi:hypothetical protein